MDMELWIMVCGFVIAFVLAFGIGANDVANSFGTSVGARVLTLKQACVLATIFEMLGAIMLGAKVSGTISKGIIRPSEFSACELELMLGYLSALIGCCVWLIVATVLNYPVSGTHSIVGATVGMAIVSKGISSVNWKEIFKIVLSWFLSPLLAGLMSIGLFLLIKKFILKAQNPFNVAINILPFIYTATIGVNVGIIFESLHSDISFIPLWAKIVIVLVILVIIYLVVWLVYVPMMRKKIHKRCESESIELDDYIEPKIDCKCAQTQVDYVTIIAGENSTQCALKQNQELQTHALIESLKSELNKLELINQNNDLNVKRKKKNLKLIGRSNTLPEIDINENGLSEILKGYLHHNNRHGSTVSKSSMNPKTTNSVTSTNHNSATTFSTYSYQKYVNRRELDETESNRKLSKSENAQTVTKFFTENDDDQQEQAVIMAQDDVMDHVLELTSKIDEENEHTKSSTSEEDTLAHSDPADVGKLFSNMQILTAIFGSFAHGGNDVSNSIGPLIGLFLIYQEGSIVNQVASPVWILFYGGVGITVGLWVLGRRVMDTIGKNLTRITASSGFVIETASALSVLVASLFNLPVSTTHCKVSSVVFTGRIRSKESVDWSLFRNIIIAWIVTIPVTGSIAALSQFILKSIFIVHNT